VVAYGSLGSHTHTHLGWFDRVRWFGRDDGRYESFLRTLDVALIQWRFDYNSYHAVAAIFVSMLELIGSKLLVYRGSFNEEVLSV
jgi:hypothetical protein